MDEEVPKQHPEMSGWLLKWTNYLRGYEKRWFVLSNGYLSYYKNKDEMLVHSTCKGSLSLRGAKIHSDNSDCIVIANEEKFHIKAESQQEMKRWLDALVTARDLCSVSTTEFQLDGSSISSLEAKLERKLMDLKTCNEMVSFHGRALQDSLSTLELGSNPSSIHSKELEERIEIFLASSSVLETACTEYLQLAGSIKDALIHNDRKQDPIMEVVLDLITRVSMKTSGNRESATLTWSDDDSQVYYNCEDIDLSSTDNTGFHMYSVVVSDKSNHGPSTSTGGYTRRRRVPDRPPVPMNIWSTIKNSINKDMSKISFPVTFSEPLSVLQRLTEDFEYSRILDKASNLDDPSEQLAYVAGFAVSSYSNTTNRVTKPFNPLLGETFECDRTDDLGWKSIAEQVSHHPPIAALHCEGKQWVCWQEQSIITKFRGQYLQIVPLGEVHLKFNTGHRYAWKKVITNIHGIIFGKMWVDQEGEMEIKCYTNGFMCKISFLIPGFFGSDHHKIKGVVLDSDGCTQYLVNGSYESKVEIMKVNDVMNKRKRTLSKCPPVIIWEKEDLPKDAEKYYNFTVFACQLNEMENGVAPTDSRNRPDQRLMEEGKWDEANIVKTALEEEQRTRRGLTKHQPKPVWFAQQKDRDTCTQIYVYKDEYWTSKKKGDWSKCPKIFV